MGKPPSRVTSYDRHFRRYLLIAKWSLYMTPRWHGERRDKYVKDETCAINYVEESQEESPESKRSDDEKRGKVRCSAEDGRKKVQRAIIPPKVLLKRRRFFFSVPPSRAMLAHIICVATHMKYLCPRKKQRKNCVWQQLIPVYSTPKPCKSPFYFVKKNDSHKH